eukprot:CAMPEP_0172447026 /NCGR_PEP_ID=MMETSP1065-20121228/6420_1 /TAXON_ID=265537 /ORGANISM="Amphiprora paludosa, Strain CCMP125" /LENGTH=766 /DNA_ID=CAMNT_0013198225 /DNA_START=86 /DNA_END=2386 /DNA_ORIENTATION=+
MAVLRFPAVGMWLFVLVHSALIFLPTSKGASVANWTERERLERDLAIWPSSTNSNVSYITENRNTELAAQAAAQLLMEGSQMTERLAALFEKATSPTCRELVLKHFGYFVASLGREEALPFSKVKLNNTCPEPVYEDWNNLPEGVHLGLLQNRSYQPPRDVAEYIDDPNNLKLLYVVLAHDKPGSVVRLVESLDGPNGRLTNSFVIHVDGKESSDATHLEIMEYASTKANVHVLENPHRIRVNWGGFTMVNATLQMLKYATGHLPGTSALDFHKVVHLSHTTYPLASNTEIRHELAKYPLDANFFQVVMRPHRTPSWNYFVECDDQLHRIFHLPVPTNATAGYELFQSSQWFIMSREFAEYLAAARPGSFVYDFLPYAEHVVVADETFFGTVLRNTEFCTKHVNRNYLYLEFDRWESDVPVEERDSRKCMMKNANHCGRSPMHLTLQDAPMLELSDNLFARKFTEETLKDVVDDWRIERELDIQEFSKDPSKRRPRTRGDLEFEGHGVLIVAKQTVQDPAPLCLGLGETGNDIKLHPCFHDWVPPNLLPTWETGAVIVEETLPNNRWEFAPCTQSAGRLERDPTTGSHSVAFSENSTWSVVGPRCMLKQMDGVRSGRCWDGETKGQGGPNATHVYPCLSNLWGQLVSFGDGRIAPPGSLFTALFEKRVEFWKKKGTVVYPYRCLAETYKFATEHINSTAIGSGRIITTPCNNLEDDETRILEWVFVPFIMEDNGVEDDSEEAPSDSCTIEHAPPFATVSESCPTYS